MEAYEKAGNEIRVNAQLIDTRTKEVFQSFDIERRRERKFFPGY